MLVSNDNGRSVSGFSISYKKEFVDWQGQVEVSHNSSSSDYHHKNAMPAVEHSIKLSSVMEVDQVGANRALSAIS
jgi:hypothetical protein